MRIDPVRRASDAGVDRRTACELRIMRRARKAIAPYAADITKYWLKTGFGFVFLMAQATTLVLSSGALAMENAEEKLTVGRVEKVWIKEADIVLDAKMDTGTLTSSIDAHDMKVFTKDDRVWVRFVVDSPDGKPLTFEREVVRFARFKKQGHDVDRRPVIELGLCVGDVYRLTQVNLSDRQRFTYPVLIGRRFLSGNVVVDTERIYTNPPRCAEMPK